MKIGKIVYNLVGRKIFTTYSDLKITGARLLTVEEAKSLPARLKEYDRWWWLRSPSDDHDYAALVYCNGYISEGGWLVDDTNSVVRPALTISNLKSSNFQVGDRFEFNGKEFEIIFNYLAFCLDDIGYSAFRKDRDAPDANNYEESDVKKYINNWFKKEGKEGKEMGCYTYTVKIGSVKLAQHMTLDTAMLLAEVMFDKWNKEPNLAITIEREDNRDMQK